MEKRVVYYSVRYGKHKAISKARYYYYYVNLGIYFYLVVFFSSEQTLIHSLNPSHLMHLWNYRENCNASFMWKYFEKYLQWTLECEMAIFFEKKNSFGIFWESSTIHILTVCNKKIDKESPGCVLQQNVHNRNIFY